MSELHVRFRTWPLNFVEKEMGPTLTIVTCIYNELGGTAFGGRMHRNHL